MDGDAKKDLFLVLAIFVALFFVWVSMGGPNREQSKYPFITPPNQTGTFSGETDPNTIGELFTGRTEGQEYYGSGFTDNLDISFSVGRDSSFKSNSPLWNKVRFVDGPTGTQYSEAKKEYLVIEVSPEATESINLSGWKVRSNKSGAEAVIPEAARIAYTSRINEEAAVFAAPGDRVYLNTGESPIGSSFRVNGCTGYFDQFQDYFPRLYHYCPLPSETFDINKLSDGLGVSCTEFISRVPRCEMILEELPKTFSSACVSFIQNELTYAGCVDRFSEVRGFFRPEWRLFFGLTKELWDNEHDIIDLIDPSGVVVDRIRY